MRLIDVDDPNLPASPRERALLRNVAERARERDRQNAERAASRSRHEQAEQAFVNAARGTSL